MSKCPIVLHVSLLETAGLSLKYNSGKQFLVTHQSVLDMVKDRLQ